MTNDITTWTPNPTQRALLVAPAQDFNAYLRTIRAMPKLSAEEELELARRYLHHQDLLAAEQLVLCNLRYVIPIARSYRGYGLPEADLIQEGSIGLMKAVKRFDISAGVRLMTFASHWIKAEMNEYVLRNWHSVKIATTKAQRKLFFKLRSHKEGLEPLTYAQATKIAHELDVKTDEVLAMDMRLSASEVPVAVPSDNSEDEMPMLTLMDDRYVPETIVLAEEQEQIVYQTVHRAVEQLNEREQKIIEARLLREEKATLAELAEELGISIERVRQIEASAMKKLRSSLSLLAA
jgi:RNA polymerase sigma-32 factor